MVLILWQRITRIIGDKTAVDILVYTQGRVCTRWDQLPTTLTVTGFGTLIVKVAYHILYKFSSRKRK